MNDQGENFQKGDLLIYQTEDGNTKVTISTESNRLMKLLLTG